MKKILGNIKQKIAGFLITLNVMFGYAYVTYAADGTVQNSKPVTGTKALFNDGTKALLIILPIAAVAVWGITHLKLMDAEENDILILKKKEKNILKWLAAGECGSAIIKIILHYYQ